jgi:hypothetical protein
MTKAETVRTSIHLSQAEADMFREEAAKSDRPWTRELVVLAKEALRARKAKRK